MSIIGKIFSEGAKSGGKSASNIMPEFRFGGWERMEAHTRPADTRTTKQLLANIEYFAQRNPEVARFKNELKQMNPKHLGLVSDICELSNRTSLLNTNIDLKDSKQVGKNVFAVWMEKLPKASRENPAALEFTQEVVNQTNMQASKYFLASSYELLDHPEATELVRATKPLVKNIAQSTLSGLYTMDYSKEKKFVNALGIFINKNSDLEKIKLIPELFKLADTISEKGKIYIDSFPFIHSKVPMSKIKENLEVFPQVAEEALRQGKDINMTNFLMHNVNLD